MRGEGFCEDVIGKWEAVLKIWGRVCVPSFHVEVPSRDYQFFCRLARRSIRSRERR